jgi:hypothetical protein
MRLIDRLREVHQNRPHAVVEPDVPQGPPASPYAGVAVLRPETIDAMSRALSRELPTFTARLAAARAASITAELILSAERGPEGLGRVVPMPLPYRRSGRTLDPCRNCGGTTTVTRLDLTTQVGWFQCSECGLRFGGSLAERGNAEPVPGR